MEENFKEKFHEWQLYNQRIKMEVNQFHGCNQNFANRESCHSGRVLFLELQISLTTHFLAKSDRQIHSQETKG